MNMQTRSKKLCCIDRRAVEKGSRPSVMTNQAEVEKLATELATSSDENFDGNQASGNPTAGPSKSPPPKNKRKGKRQKWSREDYIEVMYAFYMSLEKPKDNHTKNTYRIWRSRNPDVRKNIDENKLATTRRYIMNEKKLTDFELREIKKRVIAEIKGLEEQSVENQAEENATTPEQQIEEQTGTENYQENIEGILNEDERNNNEEQPRYNDEEFANFKREVTENIEKFGIEKMKERVDLTKIKVKRTQQKYISFANQVIEEISSSSEMSINEINTVLYSCAKTVETNIGVKPKQKRKVTKHKKPKWKVNIEKEVEMLRGEISILSEIERKNDPRTRKARKLKRKHKIKRIEDIPGIKEELKQKMQAKAQRLRRFEKRSKFYRQNKIFENDAKKFYRELGKSQIEVKEIPTKENVENFWKGIWGNDKTYNKDASWIEKNATQNEEINIQEWENITVSEIKTALTKSQKWKSPGIDKIPNFWLNTLSSAHTVLAKLLNDIVLQPELTPEWICEGKTYLLAKSNETDQAKNYRPITCLTTLYKLLTAIMTDRTYKHLEQNSLFPIEQKGCKRGSYGCKDQLMINKMILENCKKRKRNMSCAWIDYKKAFDSVPHEWILKSLEIVKVSPHLINFLKHNMNQWKTKLTLTHLNGELECDNIKIKRGIFQGDSLSPLLFCISLIPLSLELNESTYGYTINNKRVSHLFYMDDLKLYAKNDCELEGLLKIVKGFSDDIGMEFGLEKCAKATFKKGKLVSSEHIGLDDDTIVKDLEHEKTYKYLGIDESDGIQHGTMKERLKKELTRRTRLILKTELNSKNRISAINTLAIPVITYSFHIINWSISDIKRLDRKIRKLMTANSMHHPKSDIDRLYIPRSNGGRGLTQLELSYKTATIGLYRYLHLSSDWMMKMVLNHTRDRKLYSVVKEAKKFARELDIDLEEEREGEMKATESAKKLKKVAKDNGKKNLDKTWRSKPLHGQYALRTQNADVDLTATHQWLRSAGLKAETEGFIMAAQDQTLFTRNYQANVIGNGADPNCRFCGRSTETIDHLISGCSILAPKEYTERHDRIGQYIHWKICRHYSIETSDRWYEHKPIPVIETANVTILWDFSIRTDRTIQANRPDIVVREKKSETCLLIEVSVPSDANISVKEFEKIRKYKDLEIEIRKMWNKNAKTIPVIVGALGMIKKETNTYIDQIPGGVSLAEVQKIALNSTAHILRKTLSL